MKKITQFFQNKPALLFLARFVLFYSIGRIALYVYIGLLYPTGQTYWPVLDYVNLIDIVRTSLAYPTSWIMNLTGNPTVVYDKGVLLLHCMCGIEIEYPCLGIQVMIAYASLILAFKARKQYLFLVSGLLLIHLLNVGRMVGIMQLQVQHKNATIHLAHDVFNAIAYLSIVILFYVYARKK